MGYYPLALLLKQEDLQTHEILQIVLRITVDEIRKRLIACSPKAKRPQIGAISFIQFFGNTLNVHPHFHILVADGIFTAEGEELLFHDATLTPDDIADTQDAIHERVLKYFEKCGSYHIQEDIVGIIMVFSLSTPRFGKKSLLMHKKLVLVYLRK
ncbi:MAG: transposase [Verrucomicrobia bacterium]|nr:transposase [Verrucomicrobiota bacterium]